MCYTQWPGSQDRKLALRAATKGHTFYGLFFFFSRVLFLFLPLSPAAAPHGFWQAAARHQLQRLPSRGGMRK